jgi:hypothetical protein
MLKKLRVMGLPYPASQVAKWRFQRAEWIDAVDEALAYCEAGSIDPRHYFTSVVESMGHFCEKRKIPLRPHHITGVGAIKRYNDWLTRNQRQSGSADVFFSPKTDRRLHCELAYVEVYAAALASGSARRAHKIAKSAALSVDDAYARCPLRRVIALSDYLHRLHPNLPDVLVLDRKWTTREVLSVSFTLVTP